MNGNLHTHHDDAARATTTALCVDDDPDHLSEIESALGDRDTFEIQTETDPSAVRDRLDDVDCLVSSYDLGECDGATLLESVRDVAPNLPVVLHSSVPRSEIPAETLADPWTDFLQRTGSGSQTDLLGHRIHTLVDRDALETTARRCRAALESSREATLIVAPDGTITFANSQLASELSSSPEELEGRPWTELLTDGSADRLRTEAFPVAADGWSWTGPTALAIDEDEQRRTSLTRLDDGSTVLVFHEATDE